MVADKPADAPRFRSQRGAQPGFELCEGRSRKTPRDA